MGARRGYAGRDEILGPLATLSPLMAAGEGGAVMIPLTLTLPLVPSHQERGKTFFHIGRQNALPCLSTGPMPRLLMQRDPTLFVFEYLAIPLPHHILA